MQFRLRTLLIVLAVGPVVLAGAWFAGANFDPGLLIALGFLCFVACVATGLAAVTERLLS